MSGTEPVSRPNATHPIRRSGAPSLRPRLLLPILLVLCQYPFAAIAKTSALSSHLGVAVQKSNTSCLYTHNAGLPSGSPLTLVVPSPPQSTLTAEVVKPAADNCSSIDTSDPALKAYEIRVADEGKLPDTPAIAVSGFSGKFQTRGKYIAADLNRDGQLEFFRFCASSEGLHFTVWSGRALHGTRRWHQYYYLGYDLEPNCIPAETRAPGH